MILWYITILLLAHGNAAYCYIVDLKTICSGVIYLPVQTRQVDFKKIYYTWRFETSCSQCNCETVIYKKLA